MKLTKLIFITTLVVTQSIFVFADENISNWVVTKEAVLYYQTEDNANLYSVDDYTYPEKGRAGNLFSKDSSRANLGLEVGLKNNNIYKGFGVGLTTNFVSSLGFSEWLTNGTMQRANQSNSSGEGGWMSEAYLSYSLSDVTAFKIGRQALPDLLSLVAFSEKWNVFKNTFESIILINSSLPDTIIVGGFLWRKNVNAYGSNMNDFTKINGNTGIYTLMGRNKSIENLAISGIYYFLPTLNLLDDTGLPVDKKSDHIIAGSLEYSYNNYLFETIFGMSHSKSLIQGGIIIPGVKSKGEIKDTKVISAKITKKFNSFNTSLAFSHTSDGLLTTANIGGVQTILHTQMLKNELHIKVDNSTYVARVDMPILNGTLELDYGFSKNHRTKDSNYQELNAIYKHKFFNNKIDTTFAYVLQDDDALEKRNNLLRVIARYNF